MKNKITLSQETLTEFCQQNSIENLKTLKLQDQTTRSNLDWQHYKEEELLPSLQGIQRLLYVVDDIDQAINLYNSGIHSAMQITSMPKDQFITQYAALFDENTDSASVYDKAQSRRNQAVLMYSAIKSNTNSYYRSTRGASFVEGTEISAIASLPNYEELFGSLNFCTCDECRTIFSPAAYLVDLVRFIDQQITSNTDEQFQLKNRRPDIWQIPLDAKATNTEIQQLDIVNAVLENKVYQLCHDVNGDQLQSLDRNSIVKDVYGNILYQPQNTYPWNLPFHRPLETVRLYLKQLNTSLPSLWQLFAGTDATPDQRQTIATESLSFSQAELSLYTTPITSSEELKTIYGVLPSDSWLDDQNRLSTQVFKDKAGLSQQELEELINQEISKFNWTEISDAPDWSDANGYNQSKYYMPIQLTKVDNKNLYLTGRNSDGMLVYCLEINTNKWRQIDGAPKWSDGAGWHKEKYNSTIQAIALQGKFYLLGRSSTKIKIEVYDPTANNWSPIENSPEWADNIWGVEASYSTIQVVVVGNCVYVSGRSNNGMLVECYDIKNSKWQSLDMSKGPCWSDDEGFTDKKYYSTIQSIVIDQQLYLLARSKTGLEIYNYDTTTDKWQFISHGEYFTESDWDNESCYSTIKCVAVDQALFIIGRSANGMVGYCYQTNTNIWQKLDMTDGPIFDNNSGWNKSEYYSTIQLLSGKKRWYVFARSAECMCAYQYSTHTSTWEEISNLPEWKDGGETDWSQEEYYSTIRTVIANANDLQNNIYLMGRSKNGILLYSAAYHTNVFFINDTNEGLGPIQIRTEVEAAGVTQSFLTNFSNGRLDRTHRFIRLARKLGWSFTDLDWSLKVLSNLCKEEIEIRKDYVVGLAWLQIWKKRYQLSINQLCGLIGNVKSIDEPNGNSFFDDIFNLDEINHKPRWPNDNLLWDPTTNELTGQNSEDGADASSALMAALSLSETDLRLLSIAIIEANELNETLPLNQSYLSLIYCCSQLFKLLKLSITDGLQILDLPGESDKQNLQALLKLSATNDIFVLLNRFELTATWLKNQSLDVETVVYLLSLAFQNKRIPQQYKIDNTALMTWHAELREALSDSLFDATVIDTAGIDATLFNDVIERNIGANIIDKLSDCRIIKDGIVQSECNALTEETKQQIADNKRLTDGDRKLLDDQWASIIEPLLNNYYQKQQNIFHQLLANFIGIGQDYLPLVRQWLQLRGLADSSKNESRSASNERSSNNLINIFYASSRLENAVSFPKTAVTNNVTALPDIKTILQEAKRFAVVVGKFKLSLTEADRLLNKPAWFDINYFNPLSINNLMSIAAFKKLQSNTKDTTNAIIEYLDSSESKDEKDNISSLSYSIGWDMTNLQILMGADTTLNANTIHGLIQINGWLECSKKLGLSIQSLLLLYNLLNTAQTDNYANYELAAALSLGAIKLKYQNSNWTKVYQSLNGQINEQCRDVLVPYVMHLLKLSSEEEFAFIKTADQLYEYFLIDPQVNGAVTTSRVQEAQAALQLYVYRCRMNLEVGATVSDELTQWWDWISTYRVWEANRKVFLYPENYIEPELRNNKTELFKKLETDLQQSNITEEEITSAFNTYMEGFSKLAQLEFCSACTHTIGADKKSVYIIARTNTEPCEFYYRIIKLSLNEIEIETDDETKTKTKIYQPYQWGEWYAITNSISVKGVSSIFAFDRLFIFWAEVVSVEYAEDASANEASTKITVTVKYTYSNSKQEWQVDQTLAEFELEKISENYAIKLAVINKDSNDNDNDDDNRYIQITYADKNYNLSHDLKVNTGEASTKKALRKSNYDTVAYSIDDEIIYISNVHEDGTSDNVIATYLLSCSEGRDYFFSYYLNTKSIYTLNQTLLSKTIFDLLSIEKQKAAEFFVDTKKLLQQTKSLGSQPETIDFYGAYGQYYWELFFHAPFLIAKTFSDAQQFELAEKWYHTIFDPTISKTDEYVTDGAPKDDRYWRFVGLRWDNGHGLFYSPSTDPSTQLRNQLTCTQQIAAYHEDPFDPHAIAVLRPIAYQKSVFMHYIKNLLDWGDNRFKTNTRETIVEAVLYYVMAYQLLGNQPVNIGQCPLMATMTLNQIKDAVSSYVNDPNKNDNENKISEFLIALENNMTAINLTIVNTPNNYIPNSYFGIPENDYFANYWKQVRDRLYKIRHNLDINGNEQQLALFEDPIDPMSLVEAIASGASVSHAVAQVTVNTIPLYRASILIEKAKNITAMVSQFGGQLLAALEKQDAEALSLLQTTQEKNLLNMTRDVRNKELEAAKSTTQSLEAGLNSANERQSYYQTLIDEGYSSAEISQLASMSEAENFNTAASVLELAAGVSYAVPNVGSPFAITYGGRELGHVIQASAGAARIGASLANFSAQVSNLVGSWERREQDWSLQQKLAAFDVTQITSQIEGSKIQEEIAQSNIDLLEENIAQKQEIEDFLKTKFTNQALYQWMVGKLTSLYSQSYQLALEIAQSAQQAWQFELDRRDTFVDNTAWDDSKKGLLSAESLQFDLARMEKAYLDYDQRRFELQKSISLLQYNPEALMQLKTTGKCTIELNEGLFAEDYPKHYCRKIKSVLISLPTVLGPYQNINATLTQKSNKLLTSPDYDSFAYLVLPETVNSSPQSLLTSGRTNQQIALSQGIDDAGMFTLNFDDPRYLPFEGTGVHSTWELEMPKQNNFIDYDCISDVIMRINYTSLAGDATFGERVTKALGGYKGQTMASIKTRVPEQWAEFLKGESTSYQFDFTLLKQMFRLNLDNYYISTLEVFIQSKESVDFKNIKITFNNDDVVYDKGDNDESEASCSLTIQSGSEFLYKYKVGEDMLLEIFPNSKKTCNCSIELESDAKDTLHNIHDIYFVLHYYCVNSKDYESKVQRRIRN